MTITQLQTFLKIAQRSSFTSAAGELGYAQSTVTTQIKLLEDELDCLLFERLGKTVVLTEAGKRLAIYAEKMLQIERQIHLEVPGEEEPSGMLNLGVSESLCYTRLPHILMELKKSYPNVEIGIRFIMHDTFPDLLRRGEVDMVYTLNPYIEEDSLNMLYKKPEKLGFYVSPGHPLARKKKVTEEDLSDVPLLITSHNCSFRKMLLDDLNRAGVVPKIELETSSKAILKQFAAEGLGVAFMPDMVAKEEVKNKKLVRLRWDGEPFPIFSQVFIHKDRHINPVMEELVSLISKPDS